MGNEMHLVRVELGKPSYEITIGYNAVKYCVKSPDQLGLEKEALIISDDKVYGLYGAWVENILREKGYYPHSVVVPAGEEAKTFKQAEEIITTMLEMKLGRRSCIFALGGGVVGDISGFTASLYQRGVPFIQIPTTLLAQVDSSVGGKTAVNHPLGKNMIGTFYQPLAVWADLKMLETLPEAEWNAGMAEVIKYAVIRDKEFFLYLEKNAGLIAVRSEHCLGEIIERCCRIKAEIVARDEKDQDLRHILNFGHTIGHALEAATAYRHYRHGEAVAIGMAGALELSCIMGYLKRDVADRVVELCLRFNLPVTFSACLKKDVLSGLTWDKKAKAGKPVFVLAADIANVFKENDPPYASIEEAVNRITEKDRQP